MTKCFACQCLAENMDADIAFLAGIAFVIQFNDEALRAALCAEHMAALIEKHERTAPIVPEILRRRPKDA